jgi:hypothetical protein
MKKVIRHFTIYKEGQTANPVVIVSPDGEPFDKKTKMEFYKSLGYIVKEIK